MSKKSSINTLEDVQVRTGQLIEFYFQLRFLASSDYENEIIAIVLSFHLVLYIQHTTFIYSGALLNLPKRQNHSGNPHSN